MEFLENFSFKSWCFFYSCIDHAVRSNSLLENFTWKVILLNLKMSKDLFPYYHKRHSIIQNLFQKLNIFKTEHSSSEIWDCQWHKTFKVTPVFTALILLLLFQIIEIRKCCGFTFTNFFFFLMATDALATSWVTFSNTRITKYFFYLLILFPMVAWWK